MRDSSVRIFRARKVCARFSRDVERQCFNACILGVYVGRAASDKETRGDSQAALAPLQQHFQTINIELS
jgi:hypothetical protein